MKMPSIRVDLKKLYSNTKTVISLCAEHGIQVAGVVKCCCGNPEIARVLGSGGCTQIADSRIENIKRMREAGILSELWLLRLPLRSEIEETVKYADLSLNSEPEILQALSNEAVRQDKLHKVLLMLDLGDRREGILPGDALRLARYVQGLPGLILSGIGTNLTCFGGIVPDENNMEKLASAARKIRKDLQIALPWVSAGNSSSLTWMMSGKMPKEINHLRLGESILFGRETCNGMQIPGTHDDIFILRAEVIESIIKPSRTEGETHLDAFGCKPQIEDRGNHRRVLLGIGREDIVPDGLSPEVPGLKILGASSDHLVVDAENMKQIPHPGDILSFRMNYPALLSAMTSEYVGKEYIGINKRMKHPAWRIICVPYAADAVSEGTIHAPEALLAAGLSEQLPAKEEPLFLKTSGSQEMVEQAVYEACLSAFKTDCCPCVIGGDHTAAAGLAKAAVKKHQGTGWITFSAYGDFNHRVLPGKSIAGTTLSRILKHGIFPDHIVLTGLQTVDPAEKKFLQNSGIHVFTMEQIDRIGIAEVMARALIELRDTQEIIADFAVNCLDPDTSCLSPGLSLREAYCAMETLADSGKICGAVVSEFDPAQAPSRLAARKICAILASLAGKKIL